MKKLKEITKVFAVQVMIFSLLQTSFMFSSMSTAQAEVTGSEISQVAQSAMGIYGQFLGQKQNMINQQIQAEKNAKLMQAMSPSCRKADGTSCYTVAGKYFPECPLPATMATMPQNVCSETMADPTQSSGQLSSMITYESIAKGWVNYYNRMSNDASNEAVPYGLKCLQDKQKAMDDNLNEMINNLTRLKDQLNQEKEAFRANNKKILDELQTTNEELMGSAGSKNLKLKTQDFSKYFSASCQSVIGEEALAQGPSKGLVGIMQIDLSATNKRASDYNSNRSAIESEVRNDITKIQNIIQTGGLQDYFDGKFEETSKYKSLVAATQKQSKEFKLAQDRIAKELAKLNYQIPVMDKDFAVDFDEFLSGSQTFFKKQYINECVTGADKSGIAISSQQILNSLQQKSTNNGGTARDKYKAALETILNSDAFIEDKLAQIKALESTYKDITITYQNSDAQRVTETPYDLYIRTLEKCEARYKQDDQFSANGSSGISQKKKVERGQALLRELKALHDNYASNLGAKVLNQVLTCNGETKKAGSSCGNAQSFDHTDPSFCMSHASQCANEVNGCYAEATKLIDTKKAKMEALAKTFNNNTQNMVNRANQLYTAQKNKVIELTKIIQTRFPGTNFPIPENMFISMPEMKKDAYGIELASDGNLEFMNELPNKIESLKKIFKDQQTQVKGELTSYIGKQEKAMDTQKGEWQKLADLCTQNINRVSKDLARYNSEGAKQQGEQDSIVSRFCRKYGKLADNPLGACDETASLSDDLDQVLSRISNTAEHNVGEFRRVCNQYNNESPTAVNPTCDVSPKIKEGFSQTTLAFCAAEEAARTKALTAADKKSSPRSRLSLKSLCTAADSTNKGFFAAVGKQLSESDAEALKKVKNLSDIDNISDDLSDTALDFFEAIGLLARDEKGEDKNICRILGKINDDKIELFKETTSEKIEEEATKLLAELEKKNTEAKKASDEIQELLNNKGYKVENGVLIDDKKLSVEDYNAQKEKIETYKKVALSKAKLTRTIAALSPEKTRDEQKMAELQRIGEQVSGADCEVQASNTNVSKNFMGSFLNNFDQNVINGTGKTK